MALDSANKRYSMLNFGNPIIQPLIIPDGTIASADMYHFLNLYYGISLDPPQAVSPIKKVRRLIQNVNRMGLR